MPIGEDTYAYRRYLPHLQKEGKTYFITFNTWRRSVLAPRERTIALSCCVFEHEKSCWLDSACVMPDHVHLVCTPYEDEMLEEMMKRIKGCSARQINYSRNRKRGRVWQREYFDRILRSDEDARKKAEYICDNPVRAGLVRKTDDYLWIWRSWIEGNSR